jgi:hypothetical protein
MNEIGGTCCTHWGLRMFQGRRVRGRPRAIGVTAFPTRTCFRQAVEILRHRVVCLEQLYICLQD